MPAERYTHPQLNDIQEKFQLASYSEERLFHRQELRAWEEKMAKILVKRQRQELEEKRLEGLYEFLEDWGIKVFLSRMKGPGNPRKDREIIVLFSVGNGCYMQADGELIRPGLRADDKASEMFPGVPPDERLTRLRETIREVSCWVADL